AELQGQYQSRPHPRSALGPAWRQGRRGQRMHHPARRRQQGRRQESDRSRDRGGRQRHVPDRRRRRLWRPARARGRNRSPRRRGGRRHQAERIMIAGERLVRLIDAMKDEGLDALLVYGNAWQGDYLRYATDFGILEGQGLAIVRGDGHITLYVDSPLEAD